MEIKKLLSLTSSGSNMPLVDVENKKAEILHFIDMHNFYAANATEDCTAITKTGGVFEVKKGDAILKSNCEEIYKVFGPNVSMSEVLNYIVTEKKRKEEEREAKYKEHALTEVKSPSVWSAETCESSN